MELDSDSDRDMPGVTMDPHLKPQQNTDISDVGVTRTRDPTTQVSTGLLSSSGTRTYDMHAPLIKEKSTKKEQGCGQQSSMSI